MSTAHIIEGNATAAPITEMTADEVVAASGLDHEAFIADLEEKTGYLFLTNQIAKDPINLARWCVAVAFARKTNKVMDIRETVNTKHEWKSGGQRNTQPRSDRKFFRQLEQKTFDEQLALPAEERTRFVWLSKGYTEDGDLKTQTYNVGRNRFKRLARHLGKTNGIKYSLSKKLLAQQLSIALDKARAGEFSNEH